MTPDPQQIQDATNWLTSLGAAPFTFVAIIIIGYLPRMVPMFPNKWIPIVCLVLGPVIYCLLNPHPSSESARVFYTHSIVVGLFLAVAAWLVHDKWISQIEDKILMAHPGASVVLTSTAQDGTKTFTKPI